ncbi:acetyltransferase [Paenibacillus hexagrammi]|uniref:Acetyltransferase n=1 Tax=Paenibacillus hexagrammi TaxID=2908839 RepID=A0ABY3SL40_9BACL|nr:acetyltransferase [Paenibacillus sp. YPD9-1]UJF34578.1 acetyltransferase [Paenibacillus sp. YPD9-1]
MVLNVRSIDSWCRRPWESCSGNCNYHGGWDSISFLDDRKCLENIQGIPVIGGLNDYISFKNSFEYAFVGIGNGKLRIEWLDKLLKAGFKIPVIIHPFSAISKHCSIGEGTVVMPGVVINSSVKIGRGCILNSGSSVDHDSIIDEGVHVSPGVHISGAVNIGRCSWLCVGSNISNNVTIGRNVIVAAGAAVINNVSDNLLVAGVPAITKKQLGDE